MKLVMTLMILMFVLVSCGKKTDPQYQGSIYNYTKEI